MYNLKVFSLAGLFFFFWGGGGGGGGVGWDMIFQNQINEKNFMYPSYRAIRIRSFYFGHLDIFRKRNRYNIDFSEYTEDVPLSPHRPPAPPPNKNYRLVSCKIVSLEELSDCRGCCFYANL